VINAITQRVRGGEDLAMDEMSDVIGAIMDGRHQESEIADLLTALHEKGETTAEIAGAAAAMRRHMTPIRTQRTGLIDTCGTGGDASGTFNISTAAALVAAATGAAVAKHGNRGITSKSGSADVLAELGVNVEASVEQVEACLDQLGICFCFAPLLHSSMKHVAPVRKKLSTPTIFNWLGPLCNPASAPYQLLGVGKPYMREPMAQALALLGSQRALVVCGDDGLDEVTLSGTTNVTQTQGGETCEFTWTPADFGLETASKDDMLVDGPAASARIILKILAGEKGTPRDIVVLNAGAALYAAQKNDSTTQCAAMAAEAIDSGAAQELLGRLVEVSNA
jgi:anthranilate phosphoribosyltransferase